MGVDVAVDGGFEFRRGAVGTSPESVVGQQGEEPLDLVDPGGRGRRVVDVPARPLGEPVADELRFVARGVVHHHVDVEVGWHSGLDRVEEAAELSRPVPRHALADDGTRLHVERSEQSGRAAALVVVGAPLDLTGAQRQQRLRAVEGLDLALLVDAEHEGMLRRTEVEADDVAHLLDKQRIRRELEGLDPVWLERKRFPDALNCRSMDLI
jgi:hypothetical protein